MSTVIPLVIKAGETEQLQGADALALGTPASGTLTNCTGLLLTTGVTGLLASTNGGSEGWVDYGASTTLVGFSATTEKLIRYKQSYKRLDFQVAINGTSNATTLTFTLPVAAGGSIVANAVGLGQAADAGVFVVGMWFATASSAVITCKNGIGSGAWTNSGNKVFRMFGYIETA